MAYDEKLAERIRSIMKRRKGITEKKMFGGICLLLNGNMIGGVVNDDLMIRVGPDAYEEALKQKHARPMDFTGKPLKGMVYVGPKGVARDEDLKKWLERGLKFGQSLPAK